MYDEFLIKFSKNFPYLIFTQNSIYRILLALKFGTGERLRNIMKLLIDCLAQASIIPKKRHPSRRKFSRIDWLPWARETYFPDTQAFPLEPANLLEKVRFVWVGEVMCAWLNGFFSFAWPCFLPFTWWIQYKLDRSRFSYYIKTIQNRIRYKLCVLFLMFTLGFRRNRCLSIIWLIEGNLSKTHLFVYLSGLKRVFDWLYLANKSIILIEQ